MAKPNLIAPFALAFVGIPLILLGIAASALNSIDDLGLQGTVFEEGATVAVVYGAVAAGLAAVAYWIPKLTGRTLPTKAVAGLAPLALLAAALGSIPYFVAGFADQPGSAAVYSNDGPGEFLNALAAAGHAVMFLLVLAFAGAVIPALLGVGGSSASAEADDNPWDAHTLEWGTPSPAPADNYVDTPTVMSPEPLLDLKAAPDFATADRSAS
jgi:cytochrome c oxidase subunit 1